MPPTKLVTKDIFIGKGPAAKDGDKLSMHYLGALFDDGEQFEASWDSGKPFDFTLGEGDVIQGWDQGIVGMKAGGRRLLVIPAELAYGEAGQGNIPPNATLMFVVDLSSARPVRRAGPAVRAGLGLGRAPLAAGAAERDAVLLAVGALEAEDRLVGVDARLVDDLHELRLADGARAEALGGGGHGGRLERGAVPALVERVRLGERVLGMGELALQRGLARLRAARHRHVAPGREDDDDRRG